MQQMKKVKRRYTNSDASMLIAASTIIMGAIKDSEQLMEGDTTYTPEYLQTFYARIGTESADIIGTNNIVEQRIQTMKLVEAHKKGIHELGLTKIFIGNKYAADPERRDELLTNLGFKEWYAGAVDENQQAMGELLISFNENLTPALEQELTGKGMPQKRVTLLRSLAGTYNESNVLQEEKKGAHLILTEGEIIRLNAIYDEVIALCKMAQLLFDDSPAIKARYIYDRIVRAQSGYHKGGSRKSPEPPTA